MIAAAFAGKLRGGFINTEAYQGVRADLEIDARDEYVLVAVNRSIVNSAVELTERRRLRGYDAVHLACALRLNNALAAYALPSLVLVSAGDALLAAAAAGEDGHDMPAYGIGLLLQIFYQLFTVCHWGPSFISVITVAGDSLLPHLGQAL